MKKKTQPSSSKAIAKTAKASSYADLRMLREIFFEYATLGWNKYLKHQPLFAALSSRFTVKMAEDEITALKKLKQAVSDNDITEERIDLMEEFVALKTAFKSVVWYIGEAYPNPAQKKEEAGLKNFNLGGKYEKERISSMIESVQSFLNKHKKELSAHDNMPLSFIKEFSDIVTRFQKSIQNLARAKSSYAETTNVLSAEFHARNEVLNKMLRAAAVVFADDPEQRKQFQKSTLERQVRTNNKTELVISIKEAGSKKNIKKPVVLIEDHPGLIPAVKSQRYKYEIAPGTYTLKIEAPGYHVFHVTKNVVKGTKNILSIFLEPLSTAKTGQPQKQPAAPGRRKAFANGVEV